jgi:hypothetical protein
MKVMRGKVLEGRIVVEGVPLPEGREATVCYEEDDPSALTPEVRAELLESMALSARRR